MISSLCWPHKTFSFFHGRDELEGKTALRDLFAKRLQLQAVCKTVTLLKRPPFRKDCTDVCSKAWEGPEDSKFLSFTVVTKTSVKGDSQSQGPW